MLRVTRIIHKLTTNVVLSFIVHTTILILLVLTIIQYNSVSDMHDDYKHKFEKDYIKLENKVDSLNDIYNEVQRQIIIRQAVNDSLIRIKSEIIKDYERNSKNLANKFIVTDDSITLYISKKIYNKR